MNSVIDFDTVIPATDLDEVSGGFRNFADVFGPNPEFSVKLWDDSYLFGGPQQPNPSYAEPFNPYDLPVPSDLPTADINSYYWY